DKRGIRRERLRFDSGPAVAAGPWITNLQRRMRSDESCWHEFVTLTGTLAECAHLLPEVEVPPAVSATSKFDESTWLASADAQLFHASYWQNLDIEIRHASEIENAAKALANFKRSFQLGEPARYYAVLALDGDEMGKWVSGAKSPKFRDQLAAKAREHFERAQAGASDPQALARLLDHPRHLSPSYHLQFS